MPRSATRRIQVAALILVTLGCAGRPTQMYSGAERPSNEVAILTEAWNASILEIDGSPVSGTSWALLPGTYDVLLQVRLFTQSPNMHSTIWTYCRVPLRAIAGEHYESRIRTREQVSTGLSETVKIEVGIVDAEDRLRATPSSCSPNR